MAWDCLGFYPEGLSKDANISQQKGDGGITNVNDQLG